MLTALPRSAHPGANKASAQIWNAEDRHHALDIVTAPQAACGATFGMAAATFVNNNLVERPDEHDQEVAA